MLANRLLTIGTFPQAASAECVITDFAVTAAFITETLITVLTVIAVIIADGITAVIAGAAVPVAESDIGAVRVVGIQDLIDHHKEIADPPIFQCLSDRKAAIALTEILI